MAQIQLPDFIYPVNDDESELPEAPLMDEEDN